MTTELQTLIYIIILAMFYYFPYVVAYFKYWGFNTVFGNRENVPALPEWAERARAAHDNMNENMIHFVPLVLIAHITGVSNEMTVMGVTLFFYSRIAYLVIYTLGIPWLRSLAYTTGLVGEVMILLQLFK
ncbi:MAG: MAPEG family protein [Gammaproteobacteria bacterium]|nr:MAPEG family protein [Gammaproteobacteria bacterium]